MTIANKPDEKIFAANAKRGEVSDFPDLLRGWGITFDQTEGIPPMEWFNALFQRNDNALAYLLQRGIPEWTATQHYPANAYVQHNGKCYRALKESQNQTPTATNSTYWKQWAMDYSEASLTQKGITQLSSETNSTAEDRAATPKLVKDSITKNAQFVKIHLSGIKSISADLTKREEIKSVLLGDNFNSDNFMHYQVTSPNGRNHNITNLPISDKSPVMLDFVIVGAYSLFKAHYVNLNRSFFCNVNWNNETLTLDWVEEINGTKRSDSVTSDSSDTVATSKAVKSANDNANGRVSKSGDTINGTVAIKSDYWRKFRLISKDASSWWVETPPNAAENARVNLCHVTPATDTTAEIVKNIYFPAITQNETVAYQCWMKEQAESLITPNLNALTARMNTLTESVNQQVNALTESVNQQVNTLTESVNQQCEHIEIGDFSIEKYSNGLMIQQFTFTFKPEVTWSENLRNGRAKLLDKTITWAIAFADIPIGVDYHYESLEYNFPLSVTSIEFTKKPATLRCLIQPSARYGSMRMTIRAIGRWK